MAHQGSVLETPRRPPGGKKRSSNEKQNSGHAYISETTSANTSQSTSPTASQTKTSTLGVIAQLGFRNTISYAPCVGNEKIRIADGSLAPIAGKGQIVPFDGFALQNVLHDMSSRRKIGTARHSKGLYILDDDTSCSSLSRASLLSSYFSTFERDCISCDVCILSGQNNIESLFPHNHINLHNHLPSSIVTFGVLPRSPPHQESGGL
ncbi:reverse transcriptase [Cucumis melo var. makuwa]|uniref:Reverse transcriptase n=1 Tax=Cucumis melo var. makuwa TaxID=1194695 RepID=A0A5D3DHC8_CUCMM|nr:reverse transcriptase [Cucumis melo var. makuwa]TYK22760.1 reverse transcriptase [Cucumis melo var. makuwa]